MKNKSSRIINSDTLQNNLELPLGLLMHARKPYDRGEVENLPDDGKLQSRPPKIVVISSESESESDIFDSSSEEESEARNDRESHGSPSL